MNNIYEDTKHTSPEMGRQIGHLKTQEKSEISGEIGEI
jgi:hypothetical protein